MKRVLLVLGLSAIALLGFSQHPKKAVKAYEAAREAFLKRDYEVAYQQVRKALEKDAGFAEAWLLQGEIGMETRDYELAKEGYEQSLRADSMLFPPAALTLADLYDREMRYADEIKLLEWFQKAASGNKANDEKAGNMLVNARFRKEAVASPVEFHPTNLGDAVNTSNDEYVNALMLIGTELLFTHRYAVEGAAVQQEGLFVSHAAEGRWYPASRLHVHPEVDDQMGAAFLSYKGNELYFTVCGMDRHHQGCDLTKRFEVATTNLGRKCSRWVKVSTTPPGTPSLASASTGKSFSLPPGATATPTCITAIATRVANGQSR